MNIRQRIMRCRLIEDAEDAHGNAARLGLGYSVQLDDKFITIHENMKGGNYAKKN